MEIRVNIPDALAARIEAQGITVEAYIRELVDTKLADEGGDKRSRAEAVERMKCFAEEHGATLNRDLKSVLHDGHQH